MRIRTRIALGVLAVLVLAPCLPGMDPDPRWAKAGEEQGGDEPDRYLGLLEIHDMMPFSMLTLSFVSSGGESLRPGEIALAGHWSVANSLIASGGVEWYLKERNAREPFTPAEIGDLLDASDGDAFYFDGEVALMRMEFHLGITDHFSASLQLPAYSFSGGHLDGFIHGFHELFGIDQGMQDFVARNNFQMFLKLDGERVVYPDAPSGGGLGDPTLSLRYDLHPAGRRWDLRMEGAVKVPANKVRTFRSTGHADFGLRAIAMKRFAKNALYGAMDYVRVGDFGLLPRFEPNDIFSLTVGVEHLFPSQWSGVAQATYGRSMFREGTDSDLGHHKYLVSLGLRRRVGRMVYSLALTENVIIHSNSPDIAFHLGLGFLPRR